MTYLSLVIFNLIGLLSCHQGISTGWSWSCTYVRLSPAPYSPTELNTPWHARYRINMPLQTAPHSWEPIRTGFITVSWQSITLDCYGFLIIMGGQPKKAIYKLRWRDIHSLPFTWHFIEQPNTGATSTKLQTAAPCPRGNSGPHYDFSYELTIGFPNTAINRE